MAWVRTPSVMALVGDVHPLWYLLLQDQDSCHDMSPNRAGRGATRVVEPEPPVPFLGLGTRPLPAPVLLYLDVLQEPPEWVHHGL